MRYFHKITLSLLATVAAFSLARAAGNLYPPAENVVAGGGLEAALYRLMSLPAGQVLARRSPGESIPQIDSLIQRSEMKAELYAIRAQEDERRLDFVGAQKDWKLAATLAKDKQSSLIALADFYHRRLQSKLELEAVLQAANLPSSTSDSLNSEDQQASWALFKRALHIVSEQRLSSETRGEVFDAWCRRYPKQIEPLEAYFQALIADKDSRSARIVASRLSAAFPGNLAVKLRSESQLARLEKGDEAALKIYDAQFSPLWPAELRTSFYELLSNAHQLRAFLASARTNEAANPTALEPVLRAFFYYEQQGKPDLADQQLLELQQRRSAARVTWNSDELKTVGALSLRAADYDEAAHSYYSLYVNAGSTAADKSLALAALINLLLDVPEQTIPFGARDLSLYRNVATIDRHPGFLNGILSLILNNTLPGDNYQSASQTSVANFHRAMAGRLIERMQREVPSSELLTSCQAKLFSAYAFYGQNDVIIRLAPAWLANHQDSPLHTQVSLLLADAFAHNKQIPQEFAIYDKLLLKLAEASGHHPLGESTREDSRKVDPRSPEYSRVLGLYISRLTQLRRVAEAVALYRREIDRNPDDPGIYERLALFVEQNHFDSELEQTYRLAMKHFNGTSWPDKLARFYLRKRQTAAYEGLTKELTNTFDGSELSSFISAVRPDSTFSPGLYREVNLYAHQRFPHNVTFVRNLLASYGEGGRADPLAYEKLLRENWFYNESLRSEFFEYLSRTGKLSNELASLPKVEEASRQNNVAALAFYAEGKAWMADFEGAEPALFALSTAVPGDTGSSLRVISLERSLSYSVPPAFDKAIQLAERQAAANPSDSASAILVGEMFADRELFSKAAPWFEKVAAMQSGVNDAYLDSATVFWDYFQFSAALRMISEARRVSGDPNLYSYQAGAIYENQNDYQKAITEYLRASNSGDDMSRDRLIQLAKRPQTKSEIEQRTAALVAGATFSPAAFRLRLALLEDQDRKSDIRALLTGLLAKISDLDLVASIKEASERLALDDVSAKAIERTIALSNDPVDKLASRVSLARFYLSHKDVAQAEAEYSALLSENPNLLGIVRANTDFYWTEKQPKKAIETLESAAARAQQPYRDQFLREAAQKATESRDFRTARRLLDPLIVADPYNGDLLAAKALTYAQEGDNKSLLEFYSSMLEGIKASDLTLDERTQRTATLRRGYINALVSGKQFTGALEQYQILLNGYPEDEGLTREIATFAEANHLADRLIKYYEKATSDSPRDYRWPMVLARVDRTLRRYPEALAAYEKALFVRPDRADFLVAKADIEVRLLRFEEAIKTNQKLYEVSFHDTQYLASQASLHARLRHNAEAARLLKAAYIDGHPKELNGYSQAMSDLLSWHMYLEADQVFQEAKPFISPNNGDFQKIATLEGQTLMALRRPVDALEAAASIWRSTRDPKYPWSLDSVVTDLGATVDDLYTPEEKASFAAKLETPKGVPPQFNIYNLARACGFTDLTAKRLYRSALSRPAGTWRNLEQLQSSRLLDGELGHQLESIAAATHTEQAEAVNIAAVAAYDRAGDVADELRVSERHLSDPLKYARLLIASGADVPAQLARLSAVNSDATNQVAQALLTELPEDRALAVIEARGATISDLWTHSYSALTDLYFSSAKAAGEFDRVLGPRTVGAELSFKRVDALSGEVWYYYAARYADYLGSRRQPGEDDLRAATLEAAPIASNSYVALGLYPQALELSPERADVYVLWSEADKSIPRLRTAFQLLTKQANGSKQPPEYYETAKLALTRMNDYKAVAELRPAVQEMLDANISHNKGYEFLTFVAGMLTRAPDRKSALKWVVDLAMNHDLAGLTDEILASSLLAESEKGALYEANLELKRGTHEGLVQALISYATYLNAQGHAQEAWEVLDRIEPKTERPAPLLLELAAKTGRLSALFSQYDAGTVEPPTAEQILSVASELARDHADLAIQLREYEYQRELKTGTAVASAYFGLAQVRIEQKRIPEALSLVRDVTLSVGTPFENLPATVRLLEKAKLTQNAADYAKEWQTAEPWNSEANLAAGRLTSNKLLLEALRKSDSAIYAHRAAAANRLRDLGSESAGMNELDLLTHKSISDQEASQPFWILARLRAASLHSDLKLYEQSIALKPSLRTQRLALAESAFLGKQDAIGLAAWQSYDSPRDSINWLHSSPLDDALDEEPDRTLKVEELAAQALTRKHQYKEAETLYDKMLEQAKDSRIEKLRGAVVAAEKLENLNRDRAPTISGELTQPGIVKPKLAGGSE